MYKKWIMSYRDLPLLINQWANVVRWEMRTRLFLRTTEFLWQEGHTAHATFQEAEEEALTILEIYRKFAEDYLAIPVLVGKKSESEKFAGALHTYTIEAMMQDKKALQAGTSHNLGENFAKAFDVQFQDKDGDLKYVWATSWGVSTRLIGALIMAHSDDQGLVLPPKMATKPIVIVPIWSSDKEKADVLTYAHNILGELNGQYQIIFDDRDQYKPGYKFAEYELQGIPLRIEIGPRDIAKGQVVIARRDTKEKNFLAANGVRNKIEKLLVTMQEDMFSKAKLERDNNTFETEDYAEFKQKIESPGGFFKVFWCGSAECETKLQEETKATIRLIPFDQDKQDGKCLICNKLSDSQVILAKAY
jgi:prolyl-tRNA synthetase